MASNNNVLANIMNRNSGSGGQTAASSATQAAPKTTTGAKNSNVLASVMQSDLRPQTYSPIDQDYAVHALTQNYLSQANANRQRYTFAGDERFLNLGSFDNNTGQFALTSTYRDVSNRIADLDAELSQTLDPAKRTQIRNDISFYNDLLESGTFFDSMSQADAQATLSAQNTRQIELQKKAQEAYENMQKVWNETGVQTDEEGNVVQNARFLEAQRAYSQAMAELNKNTNRINTTKGWSNWIEQYGDSREYWNKNGWTWEGLYKNYQEALQKAEENKNNPVVGQQFQRSADTLLNLLTSDYGAQLAPDKERQELIASLQGRYNELRKESWSNAFNLTQARGEAYDAAKNKWVGDAEAYRELQKQIRNLGGYASSGTEVADAIFDLGIATVSSAPAYIVKMIDDNLGINPGDNNWALLGKFANEIMNGRASAARQFQQVTTGMSKTGSKAAELGVGTIAAIPNAILAMLTGGQSLTAEALSLNAAQAMGTLTTMETISLSLQSMAANPMYWTSFVQATGDGYMNAMELAQENGEELDVNRATLFAVANGLFNAAIEIGGGIETFPKGLQGESLKGIWRNYVKSNVEEGMEEVWQGMLERGLQNIILGANNEWMSMTDPNAVFSVKGAWDEFLGGFIVGGILSGGQMVFSADNITAAKEAKQYAKMLNLSALTIPEEYRPELLSLDLATPDLVKRYAGELAEAEAKYAADVKSGKFKPGTDEDVAGEAETGEPLSGEFFEASPLGYDVASTEAPAEQPAASAVPEAPAMQETPVASEAPSSPAVESAQEAPAVAAAPAAEVSPRLAQLLNGNLSNSQIESIITDSELRAAFEAMTGRKLTGTKADMRKVIKDFVASQTGNAVETPASAPYTETVTTTEEGTANDQREGRVQEEQSSSIPAGQEQGRSDTGAGEEILGRSGEGTLDAGRRVSGTARGRAENESVQTDKSGRGASVLSESINKHLGLSFGTGKGRSVSEKRNVEGLRKRFTFNNAVAKKAGIAAKDIDGIVHSLYEANKEWYNNVFRGDLEAAGFEPDKVNAMIRTIVLKDVFDLTMSEDQQDIEDLTRLLTKALGVDETVAADMIEGIKDAMIEQAIFEGIIDKDGNPRTANPAAQASLAQTIKSGKGNKQASLAKEGDKVGDADEISYNTNGKFARQEGDTLIRLKRRSPYRLYMRSEDDYILVDRNGDIVGRFEDRGHALIAANKSALSYRAARIALDTNQNLEFKNGRLVLKKENVFNEKNMKSKIRSHASDIMEITNDSFTNAKGTTKYFEINLRGKDSDILSNSIAASRAMKTFTHILQGDPGRSDAGIYTDDGKHYVFFGQTANQAKKGVVIMVEESYYDKLRKAGMAGLTEQEIGDMNPAKYMAATGTLFTPSNNDTGFRVKDAIVVNDIYSLQKNILRMFMRVDDVKDMEELLKHVDEKTAKQLIERNKVGTMFSLASDLLLNTTDGTGFVNFDRSFQMRSAGGFKGFLQKLDWVNWFTDNIPIGETVYRWYDENGNATGGIRHLNAETGVEILDKWGTWQRISDKKILLFDSTVKYGSKYKSSEDFYAKAGDYEVRSIPKENVYGAKAGDGMVDGYTDIGLAQMLRNQAGFTKAEAREVGDTVNETVSTILKDKRKQASLFGVDFQSAVPPAGDVKASVIWLYGPEFLDTALGQKWVSNKLGQIIDKAKGGKFFFRNGEANYQWVAPDLVGLTNKMTALAFQSDERRTLGIGSQIEGDKSVSVEGYQGLGSNEILNLNMKGGRNTLVGRWPSAKESDVQTRRNVRNAAYDMIRQKYGLDPDVTYLSVNDILSKNLDNDFDGDTVVALQGVLADIIAGKRTSELSQSFVDFVHGTAGTASIKDVDVMLAAIRAGLDAESIGKFDTAVDILDSFSDSELANAAKVYGQKMLGRDMSASEFRELLQAQFGVAYVLSIDFAKTGFAPAAFNQVVEDSMAMLDSIATENGYLVEIDEKTGKKRDFSKVPKIVPAWYQYASSAKKRAAYQRAVSYMAEQNRSNPKKPVNLILGNRGSDNALDAVRKYGGLPQNGNRNWRDVFYSKSKGREQFDMSVLSTIPSAAYVNVSDVVIQSIVDTYNDIMSEMADETMKDKPVNEKIKRAHERIYNEIQKAYGLNNEQLTGVLLYSLNLDNYRQNYDTFFSLDQGAIDPENTEPSTMAIIERNAKLLGARQTTAKAIDSIADKISAVGKAINDLDAKFDVSKEIEGLEAGTVVLASNAVKRAQRTVDKLTEQLKTLRKSGDGRVSEPDIAGLNQAISELSAQLMSANEKLEAASEREFNKEFERIQGIIKESEAVLRAYENGIKELEESSAYLQASLERTNNKLFDAGYYSATGMLTGLEGIEAPPSHWEEDLPEAQAPSEEKVPDAPEQIAPPVVAASEQTPTAPQNRLVQSSPKQAEDNTAEVRAKAWEAAQKLFGKGHGRVTESAKKLIGVKDTFLKNHAGESAAAGSDQTPYRLSKAISSFAQAVIGLNDGAASIEDVRKEYEGLKDTMFWSDQTSILFEQAASLVTEQDSMRDADFSEEIARAVSNAISNAAVVMGRAEAVSADMNALLDEGKNGKQKKLDRYTALQLNAPAFFKMLSRFNPGTVGYKLAQRCIDGVRTKARIISEGNAYFRDVSQMEGYRDLVKGKTAIKLQSLGGKEISVLDAVYLDKALASVRYWKGGSLSSVSGFVIGDTNIDIKEADTVLYEVSKWLKDEASDTVKAYSKAVAKMFDHVGRAAKAVAEQVDGYSPEFFLENWYAPIRWSTGDKTANYNIEEDSLYSDPRYMNERSMTKQGHLVIEPMTTVVDRYLKQMGDYIGYKALRTDLLVMNNNAKYRTYRTLAEVAGEGLGDIGAEWANKWVSDMTVRKAKNNGFFYKTRTAFQKGVLIGSPSVMMKQASSYWASMGFISPESLVKARFQRFTNRNAGKGAPMLDARTASWQIDYNISELLDSNSTFFDKLAQKSKVFNLFKNGIGLVDRLTVNNLYIAACYEVEKQGISKESPAFAKAVDDLFSNTVALSQPMFDTVLRPDIARADNEFLKMLSMFRTQQGQNFNNMVTAIGEYNAARRSGNGAVEARSKLAKTLGGQIASAISLSIFSVVADAMLHSLRKYKDKDGEISMDKVYQRLFLNFVETAAGTAWLGDQATKYLIDKITGTTSEFYGLNVGPLSTVMSLIKAIDNFAEKPSVSNAKYCAQYITQMFGIPANNVYRILNSIAMYSHDAANLINGEKDDYVYDDVIRFFENKNSRRNRLTEAILSGDTETADNLMQSLTDNPETYSTARTLEAKTIVRQQVEELLEKGEITRDQAVQILQDYGAYDEEEADKAAYGYQFENEFGIQDVSGAAAKHYYEEVQKLGISAADWVKMNKQYSDFGSDKDEEGNIVLSKQRKVVEYINGLGYSAEDRYALYDVWYDKTVSVCKTEVEYLYGSGKINATQAKQLLQKYAEMDAEKAQEFITKLDYAKRYPDLADIELPNMISRVDWIGRYATIASPAGISTAQYAAFTEVFRTTSTTYGPDGKTQVSKQEKMTAYINSLPLSSAQKDAMWKACGYSTTSKAWKNRPWK